MFPTNSVTYTTARAAEQPADAALIVCALCERPVERSSATIGLLDGNGDQAFACTYHVQDMRLWLINWARFAARQHDGRD